MKKFIIAGILLSCINTAWATNIEEPDPNPDTGGDTTTPTIPTTPSTPITGARKCVALDDNTTCTTVRADSYSTDWEIQCTNGAGIKTNLSGVAICVRAETEPEYQVDSKLYTKMIESDTTDMFACYCKITHPAPSRCWVSDGADSGSGLGAIASYNNCAEQCARYCAKWTIGFRSMVTSYVRDCDAVLDMIESGNVPENN